jgi:hypothetical protein
MKPSPLPPPAPRRVASGRVAPLISLLWVFGLLLASTQAQAIPAFARQTGSSCGDCHIGAYGPSLTPYGMRFKLGGFTDTDGNGTKIPVSGQVTWSRTNPSRGNSTSRLTQADLYLAGRVSDNVGGYAKIRSNNSGNFTFDTRLDDLDLRFVSTPFELFGKQAMLGVSINNNPGISDPIGVLPNASTFTPATATGGASSMLSSSALSNRVIGASVYGLYDRSWYGEVGSYRALSTDAQDRLGWPPNGDPGQISGTGYLRLAYMKDLKRQFFSLGVTALNTNRQPLRTGPSDDLTDLGYDLTYQFLGTREHALSLGYVNVYERRKYGVPLVPASNPALGARARGSVRDQTISMNYAFRQTYGVLAAHMINSGSFDAARYTPYGLPDTTSNLILVYWSPFGKDGSFTSVANLRLSASWFRFDKFNGSSSNVFGGGIPVTNPRDLDAFALSMSLAF